MPTILFAWELGGGLGHLMQMAALAHALVARGHRVVAAVRELRRAPAVFPPGVILLPAPVSAWAPPEPIRPVVTYAQLLSNVTWGRGAGKTKSGTKTKSGERSELWSPLLHGLARPAYHSRRTPYRSNVASALTRWMFSASAWATRSRSKGSRWWKGSSETIVA